MPLPVGVDAANLLRDRRGMGRYVRALVALWCARYTGRIDVTLLVPHAIPRLVERRLRASLGIDGVRVEHTSACDRLGLRLIWFPWNGMTWTPNVRSIVTVHDMWPFVSPPRDASVRARAQSHYRRAAEHATHFIAVSAFTAQELTAHLGISADRIDVIHHGVGPLTADAVTPARINGAERYVLFVGEAEPRKDLATLLEAAAKLPEQILRSTAFVIAGKPGGITLDLARAGRARVEVVGEITDDRLASLYAGAAAFVFPSHYEGFGLPILEAMYYGAPVVASDAAAVAEAAGDAASMFPAGDAEALARALTHVLEDDAFAKGLAAAGRARAAEMTQARCAERTLEVFERAAG